ncbi:MAG: preprotein translocase subunit SecA, partial [Chitinophagales bacterium]
MNFLTKSISKLFGGNKHEKDIKLIEPIVAKINAIYPALASLTNDQLRNKTNEFRSRIAAFLKPIDDKIETILTKADALDMDMADEKDELYKQVDALKKERDKELEKVLLEILPEAFAVMKETARRFSENSELITTATQLDRDLSVHKDFVRIEGDKAIYSNTWEAAGGTIQWNMVHYDVQLIGGIVLHQGKIAEMATGEGKT